MFPYSPISSLLVSISSKKPCHSYKNLSCLVQSVALLSPMLVSNISDGDSGEVVDLYENLSCLVQSVVAFLVTGKNVRSGGFV